MQGQTKPLLWSLHGKRKEAIDFKGQTFNVRCKQGIKPIIDGATIIFFSKLPTIFLRYLCSKAILSPPISDRSMVIYSQTGDRQRMLSQTVATVIRHWKNIQYFKEIWSVKTYINLSLFVFTPRRYNAQERVRQRELIHSSTATELVQNNGCDTLVRHS